MKEIYEPDYIETLFDDMSGTYAYMNTITSFGFSERWRKKLVKEIELKQDHIVADLMTGMGECWDYILSQNVKQLIALDLSGEMIAQARKKTDNYKHKDIVLLKENMFDNSIEDESIDVVISGFGLKTFNKEQLKAYAKEVKRILKKGGRFAMIDVSVPKNKLLKMSYLFYLKKVIPFLGKVFLNDIHCYKMLGVYTEQYGNSEKLISIFKNERFDVKYLNYFYGCATGIKGIKC